ncbi:MAG: TolC family protein [Verrucomicrobia bacterium]|nr:TolC family protein [Verrucomicrobiota bacterium]MBV8641252.1 TolC family protein [Verrucomicrobiota bacterium]
MMLKRILLLFVLVSGYTQHCYGAESYEPGKPLTLARALALTLEHSPELSAFSWDIRAAEARIIQARLIPNPEIGFEGENLNEVSSKSSNQMQNTLQLSQLIELGGKRKFRVREAQFDRESTRWDYQVKRLEVLKETSTAYIDVLAAQENVQLAEEGLAIAEAAVPAIQKRLEAGKASDVEMVRTNTAVASARIELEQAKRELQTARLNLAAQWGEKEAVFPAVMGNLDQVSKLPSLESLNAKLHRNPNVAKWTTEREKREATLNVVRAEAKPDLTFEAGPRVIQSHPVDVTFVAGFSIPLPLWNRNQGKIAEAEANVAKVADERAAAETKAYADLNEAYQTLARAAEEVRILRESVLPGAKSALGQITVGYSAGRFGQLDVLDAQKSYNETRTQYVKALADYHKAQAQIDALTALPVESPSPTEPVSKTYGNRNKKAPRNE